jgi:hypothetical protein
LQQRIVIDEIRLGMKRVPMKGKVGRFMVVPSWSFSGYYLLTFDPQKSDWVLDANNQIRQEIGNDGGGTFLILSAIDGSVLFP